MRRGVLLAAAAVWAASWANGASGAADPPIRTELLVEPSSVRGGVPFEAAVRLIMEKPWRTYWMNPGESGLATRVEWRLPPGFDAGPLKWPVPEKFIAGGVVSYGYDGEATLLAEIRPPSLVLVPEIVIEAEVTWLGCDKICVPGRAELTVHLPVSAEPAKPGGSGSGIFERARRAMPREPEGWTLSAARRGGEILLRLNPPPDVRGLSEAYFFAADAGVVDYAAAQSLVERSDGFVLTTEGSAVSGKPARFLKGVLVCREGRKTPERAYWIEAAISEEEEK